LFNINNQQIANFVGTKLGGGRIFVSTPRSAAIKIRNPDFHQKKFGFYPKGTANQKKRLLARPRLRFASTSFREVGVGVG
jgi:hypothetical protein